MTRPAAPAALVLALIVLAGAPSVRADIHHEAGTAGKLYEAYLDHLLETDPGALGRAADLAKDSSFLALEQAFDAGRRGDRTRMLSLVARSIELDPANCDARMLMARVQFRLIEDGSAGDEEIASAMSHAEGAVRLGCADGEIHDRLAAAHAVLAVRARTARDAAGALEHQLAQRRVLEAWAETLRQPVAHQRLADFAREAGDTALEEKALSALRGRDERSVLLLQRLGEVLQQLGRPEEALPVLQEAAASASLDAYSAISVRVNLGQCALEVGPVATALDAFSKAMELDPTNRLAATGRAEALWLLGRRAEAIDTMTALGRGPAGSAPRKAEPRREMDDALTRTRWFASRRLDEALPEARRAVGLASSGTPREQAAAQALLSSVLLDSGDFAGAEAAAREGLAREISHEASLMALLSVQMTMGRKADTVHEIARVEKAVSPSPSWLQRVARWESSRGFDEAARGHAERALAALEAQAGPDPDAKAAVAEVFLAAGDPVSAEQQLRLALPQRPGDDDLSFALADVIAEQGRREEALSVLPSPIAADPYRLARIAAWHAVHRGPPAADGRDPAVELARTAQARIGSLSHPAKLARFDGIVAGALLAAHRPKEAAAAFDDALGRDAFHPVERWVGASAAHEEAGELKEALAIAERAAVIWPDDSAVEMRQARLLIKLGRHDEAMAHAEHVLKAAGSLPGVQAQVASSLADAGALADAQRLIDAALERLPKQSAYWLTSGRIRDRAGDVEGALRDLRRGLELDPDSHVALNAVGYMLADRGIEIQSAITMLRRAVSLRPNEAAYLDSLGWALVRAGLFDEGRAEIEKSAVRDRDAVIVMHLATALDKLGRVTEALPLYREALSSGLDEEVERVTARVKELAAAPAQSAVKP